MTKNEWGEIVKLICDLYPKSNFMETESVFNAWYETLKDLEYSATRTAVVNHAKENQYPPSIADIRKRYTEMWNKYKALLKNVREEYEQAIAYYPSAEDSEEVYMAFLQKIKGHPQKEWISRARAFRAKTIDYVRDCETKGVQQENFKDYINEQTI